MGCFNVACGASGISMYASRAVLIPLLPGRFANFKEGLTGSNIVSNEGAETFFSPFLLPILGSLNSYGRLEDIEENVHTKAIEKHFNCSIDAFAEAVAYGPGEVAHQKGVEKIPANLAGMFVHRDIYDIFSTQSWSEFGEPANSLWYEGQFYDEVLELMGFKFVKSRKAVFKSTGDIKKDLAASLDRQKLNTDEQRYHNLWNHPKYPTVEIWSDGRWLYLIIDGKKNQSCYHGSQLVEVIEKETKTKFPAKAKQALKSTSYYQIMWQRAKKKHVETIQMVEKAEELVRNAKTDGDRVYALKERAWAERGDWESHPYFGDHHKIFFEVYKNCLNDLPGVPEFAMFRHAMFHINRLFMPTFNGLQHGNKFMLRLLYETSLEIITKELREAAENGDL